MFIGLSDTTASNKFITPWSFIHFMTGIVMYRIKPDIYTGLAIHTIYELKDIYMGFKVKDSSLDEWGNNSIINSVGDTLCFVLGQMISNKINLSTHNLIIFYILLFSIFYLFNLG